MIPPVELLIVDKFTAKKFENYHGNKAVDDEMIVLYPPIEFDPTELVEWNFVVIRPECIGNKQCRFTAWTINGAKSLGLLVDKETARFLFVNDRVLIGGNSLG